MTVFVYLTGYSVGHTLGQVFVFVCVCHSTCVYNSMCQATLLCVYVCVCNSVSKCVRDCMCVIGRFLLLG